MKIRFLKSEDEDWVGMYINNELYAEGHKLSEKEIVNAIAKTFNAVDWDVNTVWEDFEKFDYNAPSTYPEYLP